jgi:HSP20 family molecular chaperone IbpA
MQLSHAITNLETAVETQLRVAGAEIAEAGAQLMAALRPAINQTMMEVVTMAVAEISSQLETQAIDIKLVDGDPELVVREDLSAVPPPPPPPAPGSDDDSEARITVRLPGYLKDLISIEAENAGDSINSYVVELLSNKARRRRASGNSTKTTIEL